MSDLSTFIWSVAHLLPGDYKQSDCSKVVLPIPVPRRLDCVLEPTKSAVLTENLRAYRETEALCGTA